MLCTSALFSRSSSTAFFLILAYLLYFAHCIYLQDRELQAGHLHIASVTVHCTNTAAAGYTIHFYQLFCAEDQIYVGWDRGGTGRRLAQRLEPGVAIYLKELSPEIDITVSYLACLPAMYARLSLSPRSSECSVVTL